MVKRIKGEPQRKKLKKVEKDLTKKIGLFDKMGDECMTCGTFFDKTDIEMVRDFRVVVRGETVRLYCPECWSSAQEVIKDFKKRVEERENVDS